MTHQPTPIIKRMRLRYAGTCVRCGTRLEARTTADYHRDTKTVTCVTCPEGEVPTEDPTPPLSVVDGQGGASAAEEFQRRHDARRDRVMGNHPRIGRFLLAVFDDPPSTQAWAVGATGEKLLGEMLASIAGDSLRVLNDRRIPRTKANIDHLVVCPTGVFVIDAKRYRNARPELRTEGGLLRPRIERLTVGGRDRSNLVTGVVKQVALVRSALADHPAVPVRGVLCFLDANWPLIGDSFSVSDVAVLRPKKLKAQLGKPGPLEAPAIAELQWQLHVAFPRGSGRVGG